MLNQSKQLEDIGLTMDMHVKSTYGVRSVLLNEKAESYIFILFQKLHPPQLKLREVVS